MPAELLFAVFCFLVTLVQAEAEVISIPAQLLATAVSGNSTRPTTIPTDTWQLNPKKPST